MSKPSKWVWFLGIFVLVLDWITKYYTYHYIPPISMGAYEYPYNGIGIFENFLGIQFSLNFAVNHGAAWGLFSGYQGVLLIFRIVLIACVCVYFSFINQRRALDVPLVLIIGGAIGNIIDYFQYSYVVDLFHFVLWGYDYPIFNVADSAIVIGLSWIFLLSFKSDPTKENGESFVQ